ncbi:MAG: hypothetical protein FWD65_01900 [Coriobacteriia bacterium]|nr:hypothetical protein [Coriobacteriia bacterium]
MKKAKHFLILLLALVVLVSSSACSRPVKLDSTAWDSWDAGGYDDNRYPMMLWMFETNWFEGKTKADIVKYLPSHGVPVIKDNSVSYGITFTKAELFDIDFIQKELSVLVITFKDDKVVRAVYEKRKNTDSDYVIKKEWRE